MIKRTYLGIGIACLAIQAATPAVAAEHDCCVTLTPYFWAVGIDGTLEDNRGGRNDSYDFNNDFSDLKDNLDFNGSLLLEFNKGHWANYAQVDYWKANNDDLGTFNITDSNGNSQTISPDVKTENTLASAATGYRWNISERSSIDFMIGARYAKLDVEAKSRVRSVNGNSDLIDGILMMRPRFAITRNWSFNPTWAVGAGDSDLTYEAAPELVYLNECCGFEIRFGYRVVHYEFEENNVKLDYDYTGPMVGVGFKF